ncbi:MAG: hypothetical protein ACFBRM_09870 [Pikeienuella sp.]
MTETAYVGWRTQSPQAALAFLPPEPLPEAVSALLALHPLVSETQALAPRLFQARAAFDLRLRVTPEAVRPVQFKRIEEPGALSESAFRGLFSYITPSAQRAPNRPAVQMSLNLHLLTDRPATLLLMPPFFAESFRSWPGSLVCGRFPLTAWPRPLNAILEWQDRDRDWVIRRGDPLAYFLVEFDDPAVTPDLVEAATTPQLARHLKMVDNVSSVGRNVGPMFAEAARRRPKRLVVPKVTGAPAWDPDPAG